MILIIDNYDSFTFNLYQLLGSRLGSSTELRVIRNDEQTPGELSTLQATHVILSPGPGHPEQSALSLLAPEVLPQTPILGVCLGHQALGLAYGASIVRAPRPTHGRPVSIEHERDPPFENLRSPFDAALYHSLSVSARDMPPCLEVTARTVHGDVMAIRHRSRPHYGVQFHPESFMTTAGIQILDSFLHHP